MSASCRFSLPAERRSKAYPPFLTEFPPVSVPLIAMQQGIHGKPKGGDTLGLAVQELSLIVSLVFGAAHCAMQNSRKLRTACNCSTL